MLKSYTQLQPRPLGDIRILHFDGVERFLLDPTQELLASGDVVDETDAHSCGPDLSSLSVHASQPIK